MQKRRRRRKERSRSRSRSRNGRKGVRTRGAEAGGRRGRGGEREGARGMERMLLQRRRRRNCSRSITSGSCDEKREITES